MDATSWTRPEERPFVRRLLDLANRAESAYQPTVTDFLTPRERLIAQSVAANQALPISYWGGYADAERTRAVICPPYVEPVEADYEIAVLRVEAEPGAQLLHGQLLGSLLGTGIERKKVGDIALVAQDRANVALCSELAEYVRGNWRKAGRYNIYIEPLPNDAAWPATIYDEMVLTVASLRLDAVVAAVSKWPRSKAQAQIESGRVSVNFLPVEKTDLILDVADVLSVRGFGRIRIEEIAGETKRGRIRLCVGVIHS